MYSFFEISYLIEAIIIFKAEIVSGFLGYLFRIYYLDTEIESFKQFFIRYTLNYLPVYMLTTTV